MSETSASVADRRVLMLPPTKRDGELTAALLREAGIACDICSSIAGLVDSALVAGGVIMLSEETLEDHDVDLLTDAMAHQPPWSDLPVLLLTWPGADSPLVSRLADALPNLTLLERPVRVVALISAVRAALRARVRQYQIRSQIEAIRDVDRRKDEFLATLAHELRNPLAPIRNAAQMLKLSGTADPTIQRLQQIMERQINHMVRLVDDLMEVSRITRGKIDLQADSLHIAAVLQSAVELSQPLIDERRHFLTVSVPDEPLIVRGDPHRLAQIFSNLLNNAAKYSDDGGAIWLSATRVKDSAIISVKDAGAGIDPAVLPHVFELFAQGEMPTVRTQGGLGIGLALASKLVLMHGGTLEAKSEGRGRGSEFIVTLPLTSQPATAADPKTRTMITSFPHRILVVDDNEDSAQTLAALLRHLGADVCVVFDGPSAIDAMSSHRPSVVFLDIGMPAMNGYEVARTIRREGKHRHVMLVAVTGWSQQRDRRRAHAAGFDHHLVKPVDLAELQLLLERFAERGMLLGLAPTLDGAAERKERH